MKSVLAVLSLCVFPCLAASQVGTAAGQNKPGMKWEYTLLPRVDIEKRGGGDFVAGLNKLGEEGWEVISMIGPIGTRGYGETLFKRLKDAPRGAPALPGLGGSRPGQGGGAGSRGRSAFGQGSSGTGQAGGDPNASADERFRQLDKDGDGYLSYDEMPENLKAEKNKWDTNKDGKIDLAEWREYVKAFAAQQRRQFGSGVGRRGSGGQTGGSGAARTRQGVPMMGMGGLGAGSESKVTTQVISLKNATASSLQKILRELYGQTIRVASDERTNSLILIATEPQVLEVAKLLMQLDGPGRDKSPLRELQEKETK